jgi:hypothetical protein
MKLLIDEGKDGWVSPMILAGEAMEVLEGKLFKGNVGVCTSCHKEELKWGMVVRLHDDNTCEVLCGACAGG